MYRVTEILKRFNDFSGIPADVLARAAARGTAVHEYLEAYASGLWAPIPEGADGYCQSGMDWVDAHVTRVISTEREYLVDGWEFYGHVDLVCQSNMGWLVIDYKTPAAPAKTWPMQLIAYHRLVSETSGIPPAEIVPAALMLNQNGGPAKLVRYDKNQNYIFSRFLFALELKKYFDQ